MLNLDGMGVSDEVIDEILAANPNLEARNIRLTRPLHPDAYVASFVRRGVTVEVALGSVWYSSLADVFVTSSLDGPMDLT